MYEPHQEIDDNVVTRQTEVIQRMRDMLETDYLYVRDGFAIEELREIFQP